MADEERRSSHPPSPPAAWISSPHIYPHSHHGTPAQEYSGFNFNAVPMSMEQTSFRHAMPQRPLPTQLQLVMPPWPSQLSSHSHVAPFQQSLFPQPVQPIQPVSIAPLQTPVSATSTRSASTPRKTLTSVDRKLMCQYFEDHPGTKQAEIGAIFGVERSTVSKVLKDKDKYLQQDEGRRSPVKRPKGRSPDIERALAVWAKNQEKKGVSLTDDLIRNKARAFASTSPSPESHQTLSASWLEKFKLKHRLIGAKSRKGSLVPDESEGMSSNLSSSQTPSGTSPISPEEDSSDKELRSAESQESLKHESPDSYADFNSALGPFHSQSTTSANSAFTDTAPSSFSPGPFSPTSPFYTPDSGTAPSPFVPPLTARPILPASMSNSSQRPRSQTYPRLDPYMASSESGDLPTPRYIPSSMLDSPMEDAGDPMMSIGEAVHVSEPEQTSVTTSPLDTMRPPPLPQRLLETKSQPQLLVTSIDEAKRMLEAVMSFISTQPDDFLSFQETMLLSEIRNKLIHHSLSVKEYAG